MDRSCRHYNPNPWKPTVCKDCRQPQAAHFETTSLPAVPESEIARDPGPSSHSQPETSEYANMPTKGAKAKKSPSFSKKFNSFLNRDKDKAPQPIPRTKPQAVEISGPIRQGDRIQSDSSFESVSSLVEDIVYDPNVETFDGDVEHSEPVDGANGHYSDKQLESPSAQETFTDFPPRQIHRDVNGYTEVDLMSPEEPPREELASEKLSAQPEPSDTGPSAVPPKPSLKPKPPLKIKPKMSTRGSLRRSPPALPAPYASKGKTNGSTASTPEDAHDNHTTAFDSVSGPPKEQLCFAPSTVNRTTPTPPISPRKDTPSPVPNQPAPTATKAPVPARRTGSVSSNDDQSPPVPAPRTTPTPPPGAASDPPAPEGGQPSQTASSSGSKSPKPRIKGSLLKEEDISVKKRNSPRERSFTLGNQPRRRAPPAPPVKKSSAEAFRTLLPSESLSASDDHTITSGPHHRGDVSPFDVPPTKPQRTMKSSTSADTLSVAAKSSTLPASTANRSAVSSSDLHSLQKGTAGDDDYEIPEPIDPTVKDKKKKSTFSKMKHKFGKSKAGKESAAKEMEQGDQEVEPAQPTEQDKEKEGKKGFKLFRRHSGRKKSSDTNSKDLVDLGSNENSPVLPRAQSHSPPPAASSPPPPRRRATTNAMSNRPLPAIRKHSETTGSAQDSHDYAECGEKLVAHKGSSSSTTIPASASFSQQPIQEHSGASNSGNSHSTTHSGSVSSSSGPAVPRRAQRTSQSSSGVDRLSIASDLLPCLHPETVLTDPLILSMGQLQALMAETVNDACKAVSSQYKSLFTPPSSLGIAWSECSPCADWPGVKVDGKSYHVQVIDSKHCEVEDEVASIAPPHPHVARRLATLDQPPPFEIPTLPKPRALHKYLVTSSSCCLTVREFLRTYRGKVSREKYERMVCFVLLQMFLALHHLHRMAIVHSDLSPDSLLIDPDSHHVQISDFSFALCKRTKSFTHAREKVELLNASSCRFPPEIVNRARSQSELDFSGTTVFQSGCLIYELMGQEHPFENEPDLLQSYTTAELPPFPPSSPYSAHLQTLAHLLLKPEPRDRISAATSLQILSCLLWLPHSWTVQPVAESHVHNFLTYEKTRLLAELGKNVTKSERDEGLLLEGLLKSSFFTLVSAGQILKTLDSYTRDMVALSS